MTATEIHPHSKDEGPVDIGHKITMELDTKESNFWSQQCDKSLLLNTSAFLL